MSDEPKVHGLMAEYVNPEAAVEAAKRAYAEGYRKMDAYSPMPVEGLAEAIGFTRNAIAPLVLGAGISGALTGFGMIYFSTVLNYPINIGGRGLNSWPAFIPIMFELTILFGAGTAVLGMILLNRLPLLYHPVFNVPEFAAASTDRFFLCIEATDPKFDAGATRQFLEGLGAASVSEVPA